MRIKEQDIMNDILGINALNSSEHMSVATKTFEYINRHKVSFSESFEQAPSLIDVIVNDDIASIATLENFTLVLGRPKSGKTFFVSLLAASFLKKGVFMDKLRSEVNIDKPRVILFDTEQSQVKVQQVGFRIQNLTDLGSDENLDCHSLRSLSPRERVQYIEDVIYNTSDVSLVIIDGIRDLVSDINSQSEATEIASKLLKWTAERNIHLVTVLHQNKSDSFARGHLGTELVNKAETVLSLTTRSGDESFTEVEPVHCREKPFIPFAFRIDDEGMPFIMSDFIPSKNGIKKIKLEPQNYDAEIHKAIIEQIYAINKKFKYKDICIEIQAHYQMKGIQFGQNKSKDFLFYLIHKMCFIRTVKEGNSAYYYSNLV